MKPKMARFYVKSALVISILTGWIGASVVIGPHRPPNWYLAFPVLLMAVGCWNVEKNDFSPDHPNHFSSRLANFQRDYN